MTERRWYEFSRSEVVFDTILLIVIYSIIGPPKGLWWIWLPVGILIGKGLSGITRNRTERR